MVNKNIIQNMFNIAEKAAIDTGATVALGSAIPAGSVIQDRVDG